MIVSPSITMTLLWAMACLASIRTGIPWLLKNVAELYLAVRWPESSTTWTNTPRLCASGSAFAIGAEVKLYAWTSTVS